MRKRRACDDTLRVELGNVVFEVFNVVFKKKSEGHGRGVAHANGCVEGIVRNLGDGLRNLKVVGQPKNQKLVPVAMLPALEVDPVAVVVAGGDQFAGVVGIGGANKALLVVGGRIDEVTQDFFFAPCFGMFAGFECFRIEAAQAIGGFADQTKKIFGVVVLHGDAAL